MQSSFPTATPCRPRLSGQDLVELQQQREKAGIPKNCLVQRLVSFRQATKADDSSGGTVNQISLEDFFCLRARALRARMMLNLEK